MSGITFVLNIAKGALMAQQKGINVTGHNIANVNTPGFTRQRVILESNAVATTTRLKMGLGVKADTVIQYFDQFTTKNIQQKTSALSEYESKKSILDYLQSVFNETSENGLNKTFEEFWNAWQDLANNPVGVPERTALLQKTSHLCERFHQINEDLLRTKNEMNTNLDVSIDELNIFTRQIASLNERIVAAEASGTTANDLRDQRNNLIEKVSGLIDAAYLEEQNGAIMVMTSSGIALVNGNQSWDLERTGQEIYWNDVPTDISEKLSGGKIGAWMDLRDEIIPQYMANLDELAGSLIYSVNDLHFQGNALDGSTGYLLFAPNPGTTDPGDEDDYVTHTPALEFAGAARYIALSTDVERQPGRIAAGTAPGEPGNNENALAIQALQDATLLIRKWTYQRGTDPLSQDQSGTLDEFYTILAGEIGMLVEEMGRSQSFQQTMINQLNEIRDSISGVSLDEEMINLIKYQHAFTAASKLVNASDQMLQDLLSLR